MDSSLDDLIKASRKDKPKKSPQQGGGKNGKGKKGKGGGGGGKDGKAALVKAVNQSSKAKRAAKLAKARGMDVDMAPAPIVQPRKKGGGSNKKLKVKPGKKVKLQGKTQQGGGGGKKPTSLDAMIKGAIARQGAPASATLSNQKNPKIVGAADIKITIPGGRPQGGGVGVRQPGRGVQKRQGGAKKGRSIVVGGGQKRQGGGGGGQQKRQGSGAKAGKPPHRFGKKK